MCCENPVENFVNVMELDECFDDAKGECFIDSKDGGCSNVNISKDQINQFLVSAATMDTVLNATDTTTMPLDIWKAMLDTGATVTLIPPACAKQLALPIMPHTDGRRVGTADQTGTFSIQGWIELPGYIGKAAVCSAVGFIIIASCQLQASGLGMDLRPQSNICELYTTEGSFTILQQCPITI